MKKEGYWLAGGPVILGAMLGGADLLIRFERSQPLWPPVLFPIVGMILGVLLLRRLKPWEPVVAVRPRAILDFVHEEVRVSDGRPCPRFDRSTETKLAAPFHEMELAIHLGETNYEPTYVPIDTLTTASIYHLGAFSDFHDVHLLGPGALDEMESVAVYLLRLYPFRRVECYFDSLMNADGSKREHRGFRVDPAARDWNRRAAGLPPSPTDQRTVRGG